MANQVKHYLSHHLELSCWPDIMASFTDEAMDNYMYSTYNPYSFRYLNPKNKGMSWRQKNYLSNYGDTGEYFDNYQRAQLKAILSQVNPNLTPRLRKANTRDVGIQVNPRQDVSVQCSLGPRTLIRRRPGTLKKPQQVLSDQEMIKRAKKTATEGKEAKKADENETQSAPSPGQTRLRFQFLEQKYGYYHCKDCNIRWESAYVWCVQGTNKVYFKQFCRTCQKSFNPYRVEDIMCQSCKQTRCICPVKERHVDPKRPHRQDLCGRCKGKRLSCDSTFSFKYII
ncbi:unnamed protein product [Ranitomeya imitator]|uniref:3CxxC-type domain-containing protein n=1 Tax=Ranitomeya imitator TaxID=111125 RepID=A0ABN9MEC2_9NEOB|nr:unnamed protein product [Ranitomeya imitator]